MAHEGLTQDSEHSKEKLRPKPHDKIALGKTEVWTRHPNRKDRVSRMAEKNSERILWS